MNYYNDNNKEACAWLRELIGAGLLPKGEVDERDIREIDPERLEQFTQCHFFAGIGGWAYALRLADWPEDRPVWTGSCPCQSFSIAGKGKGVEDEDKHLWPAFRWLIARQRRQPATVFGEQVVSPAGRSWFSGVRSDLEALGYEVGGADLCSAGVGSPQIRQRTFWVADYNGDGRNQERRRIAAQRNDGLERDRAIGGGLAGTESGRREQGSRVEGDQSGSRGRGPSTKRGGTHGGLADGSSVGSQARIPEQDQGETGIAREPNHWGGERDFWAASRWLDCKDGKSRRVAIEPELFPLAHGLPGRVGLLRGAGNAITPEVAATFIRAWEEVNKGVGI